MDGLYLNLLITGVRSGHASFPQKREMLQQLRRAVHAADRDPSLTRIAARSIVSWQASRAGAR
jgi:hypothetical protein